MLLKNTSFITLTSFFIKKAVYCSISIRDENSSLIKHLFAKVPSGSSIVFDYAMKKKACLIELKIWLKWPQQVANR